MQNILRIVGTLISVDNGFGLVETVGTQSVPEQLEVYGLKDSLKPGANVEVTGHFESSVDNEGRPTTHIIVDKSRKASAGTEPFCRGRVQGSMWERGFDMRDQLSDRAPFGWGMVDIGSHRVRFTAFNPLASHLANGDKNAKPPKIKALPNAMIKVEGRIRHREFSRNDGTLSSGPDILADPLYTMVEEEGHLTDYFGDEGTVSEKKVAAI